jgi:ABC-type nickel/cobalt efflux system permease component RcnA
MLGFGLGLVHAFDADHVMTLSVYASRGGASARDGDPAAKAQGRLTEGMKLGLRWALGHGLVLIAVGFALLALGQALPDAWRLWAERGVAIVMIGLGLRAFFELASQRGHLHFHSHDDLVPHAHWHSHADSPAAAHSEHTAPRLAGSGSVSGSRRGAAHPEHDHGPLLVGGLHGLAGSAAVLAVVPAASRAPWVGVLYLVIFAVGVALAMTIVSGLLGELARRLGSSRSPGRGPGHRLGILRAGCASGSIALGIWMLAVV